MNDEKSKIKSCRSHKGQVQLGETTAVIIIVILLLVIGIVFWNRVSSSDIVDLQSQSQELSVIEIANLVPSLSELKCYQSGVRCYEPGRCYESSVDKVKCLDWYKVKAMASVVNPEGNNNNNGNAVNYDINRNAMELYNNYFKNSKITIVKIYPQVNGESENITIYDAKLRNSTKSLLVPIPVNIWDEVTRQTYYGMIIVEGYYTT